MIKTYHFDAAALAPSRGEALGYLRARSAQGDALDTMLTAAFDELKEIAECRCRAGLFPVEAADALSPTLRREQLANCDAFWLFSATTGAEIDRRITRLSLTAPSRAAVLDAAAGALVEALCDTLTDELQKETPSGVFGRRFSPGYGSFPLSAQKTVFEMLQLSRIGVGLNDSLLLSPAKTVTAVIGVTYQK